MKDKKIKHYFLLVGDIITFVVVNIISQNFISDEVFSFFNLSTFICIDVV